MNRREFITTAAVAGAGLLILPSGVRGGEKAPSNKLNIALIGVWGRGLAHYGSLAEENVVALCDVNEKRFPEALAKFPNAKTHIDWRKCLDQKGLDAVVCCTADHTHAFVSNWALNRDLHVYQEKPLAITCEEARIVRANWMKRKAKLATQVGMQRHAIPNFNRVRELVRDGAIGDLTAAYAWGDRQIRRPGYLPAEGQPPADFHYDLWLGPSPEHPYNPGYFSGGPGANCLQWNMYWDFGAGQIGDMGSHTMDLLWNAVDAKLPTTAEAKGEAFNPDVTPVTCESHFDHPANDWRGPIRVSWYQGGALPASPKPYVDLKKIGHGAMFKGSKGHLICDFDSRVLLPFGSEADMTYYKPRAKDAVLPDIGHFQKQWLNACKNPTLKTACDFEYSGNMIEQLLLGLVAYRVVKKLEYDGSTGKLTNFPEANEFLARKNRAGWTING
ncbi:MAG: Gfo/Idh/MocA family oxidoreductase [Planctomycetota bacterium]|nr:Gfo/Idh/MocA family oxidoreductase [Planctomycetota bacterium]